ncbi:MAG: cobalt transporter CbiM [Streptococcus sp.]|nr:cobalt transporter CbiM [Streptococcus sp.]
MHIPENYLSPITCAAMGAVMIPIWYKAVKKVEIAVQQDKETIPMLAITTSLSFLIMMFNLPAPGGTTAHAVGAVLIALLMGPWAATLSISIALAMQALLFGDGGILAFGANCFMMGVVMPFSGYAIHQLLTKKFQAKKFQFFINFLSGYVGILLAALGVALLLGIQPLLFKDSSGQPLYNPYPLNVTIPAMGLTHLIIGIVEGFFTAGVYQFIQHFHLKESLTTSQTSPKNSLFSRFKSLFILLGALIILTPLGLLASGTAFAEWDITELVENLSSYHLTVSTPKGMISGFNFNALIPDYSISGIPESLAYILSAITAVLLFFILYRLVFGRKLLK